MILNKASTLASPYKIFPYQMLYGQPAPLTMLPFLALGIYKALHSENEAETKGALHSYFNTLTFRTRRFCRMEPPLHVVRQLIPQKLATLCGNNRRGADILQQHPLLL